MHIMWLSGDIINKLFFIAQILFTREREKRTFSNFTKM